MTWQKLDPENVPWQCKFVFGEYHTFASDNTFACGPTGAIFAWVMYKYMLSLSVVSKFNKCYFSTEKSIFL